MKKILLSTLATIPMFASSLNINSQNTYSEKKPIKSKSHWIFSLGSTLHRNDLLTPTVELGFGYQSKLEEGKYFQSQRIEVAGGGSLNGENGIFCSPKLSALHYFNLSGESRYYYLLGTGVHGYFFETEMDEDAQVAIIASLGFGVELGKFTGTTNNFQLTIDQPALFFGDSERSNNYTPFVKLSYIIGF